MNRFSKRGDPIENRRTPDASKRSIQRRRRRRTTSSRRMRKPSFTERQKRKHARSARVKKRFTQLQKYARAREREREKEKEMNQTMKLLKKRRRHHTNAPALASFCATNNPSNGLFLCHWRTLARFSIASSAASSNRKRQYACGLIDCSICGRES